MTTDARAAVVAELLEAAKWMNHGVPDYVKRAAALLAADGERLAKFEAMEARAKDADAIDDAYERGRTCDKRACGDALSAVQDYILAGHLWEEDPR